MSFSRSPWLSFCCLAAALPVAAQVSPFGVCAHLGGGDEFKAHEQELQLMQDAGIHWARADFSWSYFEGKQGQWKYDNYDTIVAAAKRHDVNLLPILCYNVDWATPAHEHLTEWCNYVKTVVTRYQGDLKYWEVWNEPNIGFWKPKPNPTEYTALLKATYATIKAINPALNVVYGGTAGVPFDFLRTTFEQGATKAFDVLAVHPYQYPTVPESSKLVRDLLKTRQLLVEFGSTAPVWITEFGWPTHIDNAAASPEFAAKLIAYSAKLRFPQRQSFPVAVMGEQDVPFLGALSSQLTEALNALGNCPARQIPLAEIPQLDPKTTPVLVMPTGEHYPADDYPAMLDFVKRGGLLCHFGGVPFYYKQTLQDGEWKSTGAGEDGRAPLHVGWKAWWTEEGLPKEASKTTVVAQDAGLELPEALKSTRWLTDAKLQGNDRFVPLLEAHEKGKSIGYPVALYLYDSDLKGGFLGTILSFNARGVTPETQGKYLPRALLLSLGAGVECIDWYEFREGGKDRYYNEHHFGILNYEDMAPKPGYTAYQALTKALGKGQFLAALDLGEQTYGYLFEAGGSRTLAVWRAAESGPAEVRLKVAADGIKVTDHLGRPLPAKPQNGELSLTATDSVTYVSGLGEADGQR